MDPGQDPPRVDWLNPATDSRDNSEPFTSNLCRSFPLPPGATELPSSLSRPDLIAAVPESQTNEMSAVDRYAAEIADWHRAPVDEVYTELSRLEAGFADFLWSIDGDVTQDRHTGIVAGFLRNALEVQPWQTVQQWLQSAEPRVLAQRVMVADYLANDAVEHGVLLFSRSELAERLEALRLFLGIEQSSLLSTGHPQQVFQRSHCLWWWLARLYPTRLTKSSGSVAETQSAYDWIRKVPSSIGRDHEVCSMAEADLIPDLSVADAERIEYLRPRILNLKRAVLNTAASELLSECFTDYWPQYVESIRTALTEDEFCFCLSMDRIYAEHLGHSVDPLMRAMLGLADSFEPGGLTNILSLICHVGIERTIGTMHEARAMLDGLIVLCHGDNRLKSLSNTPGYFGYLGEPSKATLDQAIMSLLQREEEKAEFTRLFTQKVATAVNRDLDRQIEIQIRCRSAWAIELKEFLEQCARRGQINLESNGRLQALPSVPSCDQPTGDEENIFRRDGEIWEVRFRNGIVSRHPHRDGFLYLRTLLQNPGRPFDPSNLYREKLSATRQPQTSSVLPDVDARHEHPDGGSRRGNGGETQESLRRLNERRREIDFEIDEARADHDDAKLQNLETEKEEVRKEISDISRRERGFNELSTRAHSDRTTVKNAILRVRDLIETKDHNLNLHLRDSIKFLDNYVYETPNPPAWCC